MLQNHQTLCSNWVEYWSKFGWGDQLSCETSVKTYDSVIINGAKIDHTIIIFLNYHRSGTKMVMCGASENPVFGSVSFGASA